MRRHERRRRRAEEQLAESEANLARVDDILAELRPQARRLAQQAEQQANRLHRGRRARGAILALGACSLARSGRPGDRGRGGGRGIADRRGSARWPSCWSRSRR